MKKWSSLILFADTGQFDLFFNPLVSIVIVLPSGRNANKSTSLVLPRVIVTMKFNLLSCEATKNSAAKFVE